MLIDIMIQYRNGVNIIVSVPTGYFKLYIVHFPSYFLKNEYYTCLCIVSDLISRIDISYHLYVVKKRWASKVHIFWSATKDYILLMTIDHILDH